MIIKGLFGKDESAGKQHRKASSTSAKYCGICQTAFKRGTDDIRLANCSDCLTHERHLDATHWKSVFAQKRANSLSPDMAKLAEKLASNRALIEGQKMRRANTNVDRSERSLTEIRRAQASPESVDFGVVKAQVAGMLPSILNELGLARRVNADLLVDLIVPIKIAAPIADPQAGRSALKAIVHEALEHLDVNRDVRREAAVKPHGTLTPVRGGSILNEGFGRVSNDYGNRTRSLSRIATDMQDLDDGDFQNTDGDGTGMGTPVGSPMGDSPMMLDEGDSDTNMGAAATAFTPPDNADGMDFGSDPSAESGPSADVAGSAGLDDDESGVQHLDDAEADRLINEPPGQPQASPDQMLADDDSQMFDDSQMPNEGIGTYSGGENMSPDAGDMDDMPAEGAVNRVNQAGPDIASRQIAFLRQKQLEKSARSPKAPTSLFNFAGKLTPALPVQSVRLSAQDRAVIERHPPVTTFAAVFTDRSRMAWDSYLTDRGFLMVSAQNSFHAKNLESFADFVETDGSFSKWAALPPELEADMPPAFDENHDVDDMAMPELAQADVPGGEPTPSFNDIPETHLDSSPDNSLGGGMMNDQEAIYDNSGDTSNPADVHPIDDEVVDTAADMLPQIEQMFPDEDPEEHQNMAISAALNLLLKRAGYEDAPKPEELAMKSAAAVIKLALGPTMPSPTLPPAPSLPPTPEPKAVDPELEPQDDEPMGQAPQPRSTRPMLGLNNNAPGASVNPATQRRQDMQQRNFEQALSSGKIDSSGNPVQASQKSKKKR